MGMNAGDGRSLTGNDHIRQSITDILATPLGSRVMRRDYGSLIPALIDQPLNNANLLRLYSATVTAVSLWEPRVRISRVNRTVDASGKAVIEIGATIKDSGEQQTFGVPVGGV